MGKRRGGKKGGVAKKNFKVVGSKSLKAKNKAKPVKLDLKKANKAATKEKLKEVDEQLVQLQEKIIKKPDEQPKKKRGRKGKNNRAKMAKDALEKNTEEAAEQIEKMDV